MSKPLRILVVIAVSLGAATGAYLVLRRSAAPAAPTFRSRLAFDVYALDAEGRARHVGRTPAADGVALPAGARWFVHPIEARSTGLAAIVAELRERAMQGLCLRDEQWIEDADLVALEQLDDLTYLDLSGLWRLTDAGLAPLARLTRLTALNLKGCYKLGDRALAHLRNLTAIETLNTWGLCNVTGDGMLHLQQMKQLRELTLTSHCEFSGLDFLRKLPIRKLDLSGWAWLGNSGLDGLQGYDSLSSLTLVGCGLIDDEGMRRIQRLPSLERLVIPDCNITTLGLSRLASLRELRDIVLPEGIVDDAGLAQLVELKRLERLRLRRCRKITDQGLARLRDLPALKRLDLSHCRGITDAGTEHLAALGGLVELDLRECPQLGKPAIAALRRALPRCKVLAD